MPVDEHGRVQLAEALFQSDQDYFAAAALATPIAGGTFFSVPGLEHVPAGAVLVPHESIVASAGLIGDSGRQAAALGASMLRFYTRPLSSAEQTALVAAGLRASVEYAFIRSTADAGAGLPGTSIGGLRFRQATSERDWQAKGELAASLTALPDGKPSPSRDWTDLERRKCAAGYMDMWLVERDEGVCGAFGLARGGQLLRLKNLVVHPTVRRLGIGMAIVAKAVEHARALGFDWVGAYGLPGQAGSALYSRTGFQLVGEQTEWVAPLAVAAPAAAGLEKARC